MALNFRGWLIDVEGVEIFGVVCVISADSSIESLPAVLCQSSANASMCFGGRVLHEGHS